VNKDLNNLNNFCLKGRNDSRSCLFRIDTGSDVTVLKDNLLKSNRQPIPVKDCLLRYPTRETVSIENKAIVKSKVRKFFLNFPVYIAEIEDYILGIDFLK